MRVSELAQRTGVSAHRLRRYEAQGLIRAERKSSGYREFTDRTVREVIFIAMGRDLGFSLADLAQTLPRYRAGTLTFEQMVEGLRERIAEVDAAIAAQRAVRKKLVAHIGWLEKRQREHDQRRHAQRQPDQPPATPWPRTRKTRP